MMLVEDLRRTAIKHFRVGEGAMACMCVEAMADRGVDVSALAAAINACDDSRAADILEFEWPPTVTGRNEGQG